MTRNLMLAMLMAVIMQCNYCAAEIKVAENASALTVDGEMVRLTAGKGGEIKFVSPDNSGSAVSLTPLSGDAAAEVSSWKLTMNTSGVIMARNILPEQAFKKLILQKLAWSKNENNYLHEAVRQNQQLKPYADKISADLKVTNWDARSARWEHLRITCR